ncbi:MAG: hypothetical protein WCR72_13775 [Bacteroidota bacterium]
MKKIALCAMALGLSLTFYPLQSNAATTKNAATTTSIVVKPENAAKAKVLETRLNEISKMDKSGLKSSEKQALRKEVRSIKQQLSELGGGLYISAGAIIIILLLLIIFL